MIDNDILKEKIGRELKQLNLTPEQEDTVVKELNYLANLLIDIYISKTSKVQEGEKKLL